MVSKVTMAEFKEMKTVLKETGSNEKTAKKTGWSLRTVGRVKASRSFKAYKESQQG